MYKTLKYKKPNNIWHHIVIDMYAFFNGKLIML